MEKIILSINPQWLDKIRKHKKIIEIRKTKPRTPFEALCYETKKFNGCGEITSKFKCFQVDKITIDDLADSDISNFVCRFAGISKSELKLYMGNKGYIYLWYVDEFCDIEHEKINYIPQSWVYSK